MTIEKQIQLLEKGIKSSITPDNLKEKMRTKLNELKTQKPPEPTSNKKPEEKPSNEDTLAILYNADSKGWSATKAESGGDIKASDELTEKYANAVSKALKDIKKGSLSEEIFEELTDGNNHLLNEFLVWNGYYDSVTTDTNKSSYQRIWDKGNRQVANPEIITLGAKKIKPSKSATPIKKVSKKYYRNREIKSVTVLEKGKKVTYAGKDVLNGANFMEEGGLLISKSTYVPVRNIVEVTFEDGSKEKPSNGYHIKNGATPIMEHGGEVWQPLIQLIPLELEPLSSQLKSYTADNLVSDLYTDENGEDYSTNPGRIIVHKESGKRFEMPKKIFMYLDGFNLVYDPKDNKIKTWEEGKVVAKVKEDGELDFSEKDQSISINKTQVKESFEKKWIPEKSNEKWAYILIENKLQNLYAISEDLEDDKTTSAWKSNQAKIKKFEDFLHRLERKYEHGGSVELPEGSFISYQNYYLEKGGKVDKEYSLIGTKVKSDVRKQSGYVTGYNGNYVDIYYPSLEFAESVLYKGKDQQNVMVVEDKSSLILNEALKENELDNYFIEEVVEESTPIDEYEVKDYSSLIVLLRPKVSNKNNDFYGPIVLIITQKGFVYKIDNATFEKWEEITKDAKNDKLTDDKYGYVKIGNFLKEEYKLGGQLLSAWKRERKYVNKSEDYEVQYAKGKNRKGYGKYEKGGPIPEKGDFAKVPIGYGMYHYGLIKGIIKNEPIYPKNGYEVVGIGDVLHPEQFEVVTESEFKKQKSNGTDVKTNSFLVIEEAKKPYFKTYASLKKGIDLYKTDGNPDTEEFLGNYQSVKEADEAAEEKGLEKLPTWFRYEKGGVLSKGDNVKHLETKKEGKIISIRQLNELEDEVIVEFEDGSILELNSFDVEKILDIRANLAYDPNSGLTIEEWKAKHNIQNYGKGGKTDKEDTRGANFRLAREIRKPGEKWQDAVSRATKMLK